MTLYLATTVPDLPLTDAVAVLRAEGYGHLCAVGDADIFARTIEPPVRWCLSLAVPSLNLASDDRSRWEYSVAQVRRAISVAASQGAPKLSLSPGYAVYGGVDRDGRVDSGKVDRAGARLRLLRALDTLANHADNVRVGLSLRLQPALGREELLTTPEAAADLLGTVAAPHLRLGLDLGHVKLTARQTRRDADDLVEGALPQADLVWLHGNEGEADRHDRPKEASWETSQLARPAIRALPLIYDARRQPLPELRAVINWLVDGYGYTV